MTSKSTLLITTATLLCLATPALAQQAQVATQDMTGTPGQTVDSGQNAATETPSGDVVVTGIRRSLQDSIDTKRRTNAIVDVISAEDVGKFPDTNVAESLSHLPGVTVDHYFGEGEQVSIAGTEPALNRILIDGHSIASANWGGNPNDRSSRTFNYSLLSPEIISQAVLYKTPEARLQEGAIGGTVDIVTRKPLDLKPNTITATAGAEYNDRSNKANFRGSALYSWRNESETFAILGSINYDKENLSQAGVEVFGYYTGDQFVAKDANGNTITDASGNPVLQNPSAKITGGTTADLQKAKLPAYLSRDDFDQVRERIGYSLTTQFRPTPNLTLTANAILIRGDYDNLNRSEFSYNTHGDLLQAANVSNGLITSTTFGPSAAPGDEWTGEVDTDYRRTRLKNDTFTGFFDWRPGSWQVSGNGGYTRASGGKNPEYLTSFYTRQGFTASAVGKVTSLNWANPASDASQWVNFSPADASLQQEPAVLAATNGAGFYGAQVGGITNADQTVDREVFGQIDVARDLDLGFLRKLWFGVRANGHRNQQTTYGGATFSNTLATLASFNPGLVPSGIYDGLNVSGNGTPYAALTQAGAIAALNAPGNLNVTRSLDTGSYFNVAERILTGYVQLDYQAGKIRGNIGGRFVSTRDVSHYYLTSGSQTALVTTPNTDNRFLPAFNIAYDATSTVVLRAGAAKVIARPRFSDLAGSLSLDDTTRTGGGGNPDLKPYAATNFGVSAEWYFARQSYLSGEFFYRDISNYIGNSDVDQTITNQLTGRTLNYAISRPINGGKASVTGFSLTAQANLFWGFGIQSNYTFASADTGINGQGLPFLSRNTINIIPYFEKGPFSARVSYNYRSKYFYQFGRLQSADYTDAYRQLDFSASYNLNRNIRITANASNLLDETYYQYSDMPSAPTAIYKNGRVFALTATFRM